MLVNFFKNIFPKISNFTDNDEISLLYRKFNSIIIKYNDEEESLDAIKKYSLKVSNDHMNDCLEKAIIDNNLLFVKVIYQYLRKVFEHNYSVFLQANRYRNNGSDYKDNHKSLFYYAKVSMDNNRIELFDYFIQQSKKIEYKPISYEYSPKESFKQQNAKSYLVETAIQEKKTDYINILKHYHIFNGLRYIKEHLENTVFSYKKNEPYFFSISSNRINYILDDICYPEKKYNSYLKNYFSELLFEIARFKDLQPICFDIILNLVNRGADFSYFNDSLNRSLFLDEKRSFNLVNLLIEDGFKDIDSLLLKSAKIPNNFSTVNFLLGRGANINLDLEEVDITLYDFLKKFIDSENLFKELSNNLNNEPIKIKKNKL
jgi:hypothetical protein